MYNLYRGNSGKVKRVEESRKAPPPLAAPPKPAANGPPTGFSLSRLAELLPRTIGELESEDILLMLILYLMYRESGDTELLIIMGAMFLM